jgi:putative pyruvate formate lyase activating enzyme
MEKNRDFLKTDSFTHCTLCPHECGVNRYEGATGKCRTDSGLNISSICIHRGEEPPISGQKGIVNIFFSGCNLRCSYCQNHEISRMGCRTSFYPNDLEKILDRIEGLVSPGIKGIGFVSPSHVVPHVVNIIKGIRSRGIHPVTVYNTNSYDKVEALKSLDGLIDVYLPDFKYVTPELSKEYSGATDYPSVALNAVKEMYFQKGSVLLTDDEGVAEKGILLRHLVLPGHACESKKVLQTIAEEISTGIHISLMSQYHPTDHVRDHPVIGRSLYRKEYEEVVEEMERLGFRNGYIQDMESFKSYRPDFSNEHPFE